MSNISKIFLSLATLTILLATIAATPPPKFEVTSDMPIWTILQKLGKVNPNNLYAKNKGIARKGKELVMQGRTTNARGIKTLRTSPRLTCAACHTTEMEHPQPVIINPQKRLEYADSMGVPFLPGSPFVGLVNRIRFFNNDYQTVFPKKKQVVLRAAHREIRKAIQTCNTIYAKGRELKVWEIESILAYLWTMELKMGDINVGQTDLDLIITSVNTNKQNARAVNLMRRYYREVYPATLVRPIAMKDRNKISPIINSFKNGKRVYKWSCLHCHEKKRFSDFKLDNEQATFKMLKNNFDKEKSRLSIYNSMRYVPTESRLKAPHYTAERMSDQQIQDLRFFITQMARLGEEAYDSYQNY